MTAEEIRKLNDKFGETLRGIKQPNPEGSRFIIECAAVETLIEIAAQLAEMNERQRENL